VIVTGGLWLLAIPLYEKRCVICGSMTAPPVTAPAAPSTPEQERQAAAERRASNRLMWMLISLPLIFITFIVFLLV